MTASYEPGDWVAFAGPNTWLLLDAEPDEPIVADAWALLRREAGQVSLVELLIKRALERECSFALAVSSELGFIVSLGGAATADIHDDETPEHLACPKFAQVTEFRLGIRPQRLVLSGGSVRQRSKFPLESGIASAALLILRWPDAESVLDSTGFIPRTIGLAAEDGPATRAQLVDTVAEPDEVETEPAPAPAMLSADASTPAAATLPAPPDHDQFIDEVRPESDIPAESVKPEGAGAYDHLFGQTMTSSVDAAAIRPEEEDETEFRNTELAATQQHPTVVTAPVSQVEPATPNSITGAASSQAGDTGLIESVPWSSGARPSDAQPTSLTTSATAEDAIGLTVNREVQAALLDKLSGAGSLRLPPPLVHAVRCPFQHPNPANSGICRVCGSPISEQVAVTVPRPVLGRLELSTGDSVTLDRGVILGRGPSWNRPVDGERPHLVKLPSPESDISRDHLEVRLDGWHVLVVDLNSTNGTVITRTGSAPERLRPDQPTMIELGTIVSLANEVSFTYYATV